MGSSGGRTAAIAELSLWVVGAALIAGAAGVRVPIELPSSSTTAAPTPTPGAVAAVSASPSPTATLAPSPTPVPTLSPIVRKLQAILARKDFQFQATGTGTQSALADNLSVDLTMSGSVGYKGGDEADATKMTSNGTTVADDTVYAGSFAYERINGGPWIKKPRKSSDTAMWRILLSPSRMFVETGVETRNGSELHRLEVADPAALGAEFDGVGTLTDAHVTAVFWTKDDGTPVVLRMEGTWTQPVSGITAKVTTVQEFTITRLSGVTIATPKNPWQSIVDGVAAIEFGVPPDWRKSEANQSIGATTYQGASGAILYLTFDAAGMTLDQATDAVVAAAADPPGSRKATTVAGAPAILVGFHRAKQKDYLLEAVVLHGGKAYEIGFLGSGSDAATDALAAQILGTLAFTK